MEYTTHINLLTASSVLNGVGTGFIFIGYWVHPHIAYMGIIMFLIGLIIQLIVLARLEDTRDMFIPIGDVFSYFDDLQSEPPLPYLGDYREELKNELSHLPQKRNILKVGKWEDLELYPTLEGIIRDNYGIKSVVAYRLGVGQMINGPHSKFDRLRRYLFIVSGKLDIPIDGDHDYWGYFGLATALEPSLVLCMDVVREKNIIIDFIANLLADTYFLLPSAWKELV